MPLITVKDFRTTVDGLVESDVHDLLGSGGQYFHGLLMASDEDLGWKLPIVQFSSNHIRLSNMLGQGASAVVYAGEYVSPKSGELEEVVVKWFRKPSDTHQQSEIECLTIAKPLYPLVPKLVGISDDKRALLLQPVGRHFASRPEEIQETRFAQLVGQEDSTKYALSTAREFCLLVDIIAQIHGLGLIHRDIKPSNFFAWEDEVLLSGLSQFIILF